MKVSIGQVNAPLRPIAVIERSVVYSSRLVGEKKKGFCNGCPERLRLKKFRWKASAKWNRQARVFSVGMVSQLSLLGGGIRSDFCVWSPAY